MVPGRVTGLLLARVDRIDIFFWKKSKSKIWKSRFPKKIWKNPENQNKQNFNFVQKSWRNHEEKKCKFLKKTWFFLMMFDDFWWFFDDFFDDFWWFFFILVYFHWIFANLVVFNRKNALSPSSDGVVRSSAAWTDPNEPYKSIGEVSGPSEEG